MPARAADRPAVTAGRPRDERIDRAVLDATRDLVAEVGYSDLTLTAVAARASTSVPALRRRWPSKAHLVHEAVFPDTVVPDPRPAGSLAAEIRLVVDSCVALLAAPVGQRATPGLIADLVADPALQHELSGRLKGRVWEGLGARIALAVAQGEARPDVDVDLLVELAFGATMMAVVLREPVNVDERWAAELTATLLHGIAATG